MNKIARSIFEVVAGFVVASAVMMVIETINGHVLNPELGKAAEEMTDREAIKALMASLAVMLPATGAGARLARGGTRAKD
jgi:hypothetical protein